MRKMAAVLIRGGLLLVVRKRGTSVFISPGGKPEPGESPRETLARELEEETGLRLRSCTPFGTFCDRSAFGAGTVEIDAFLADADGAAVPGAEIEEVAWIDAGYREDGIGVGSVFDRFVVPALLASGRLRERREATGPGLAVVADLDGTLVFDGASPGPDVSAVLADLADSEDIRLVFATSRAQRGVRRTLGRLADRADLICCNGGVVVSAGVTARRAGLPPAVLGPLISMLRAGKSSFYLEYGDRFLVSGDGFPWMDYPDRVPLAPGDRPPMEGVVKLVIAAADGGDEVARLRALVGSDVEVCAHAGGVLDVMPAGVGKAGALAALPGVSERAVIALGDDLNDQELLGQAAFAAVVGERLPGLERARHIRRVPARDAAVAAALRDLVGLAEARTGT